VIAFLEGKLVVKTPTYVVIDCGGIGYSVNISLHTYELLGNGDKVKVITHLVVKEDSHTLYGFAEQDEKDLFLHLLSVNGVGPNMARMILSSMKPFEVIQAITTGNWTLLKSVKGIGPKTAQRIAIDLQDKLGKQADGSAGAALGNLPSPNRITEEALAALMMLGFNKNEAEKGLLKIRQQNPNYTLEELIKHTLKVI
jgi:Holliday junction DNA helicase RuvA